MPAIKINKSSLHYRDEGTGPVLLLGHSYLWDSRMWDAQIESLSDKYRCIAPDLWGHGQSDAAWKTPYLVEELADDYEALIDELGIKEFFIAGLSVGGMWGTHLALRRPEQVKGLALLNTFVGEEPEESRMKYMGMIDMVEKTGCIPPPLIDQIVPLFFSSASITNDHYAIALFREALASWPPETLRGVMGIGKGIFGRSDLLPALGKLQCPVLIIAGQEDRSRPPHESKAMRDVLLEANVPCESALLSGAGHISAVEQPNRVSYLLHDFLEAQR